MSRFHSLFGALAPLNKLALSVGLSLSLSASLLGCNTNNATSRRAEPGATSQKQVGAPPALPAGALTPVACWAGPVTINANTLLDGVLDPLATPNDARAGARARLVALQTAAAEWNAVLATIGAAAGVNIIVAPVGDPDVGDQPTGAPLDFALDQGAPTCPTALSPLFLGDFTGGHAHHPNGQSTASFAHGDVNKLLPGWTVSTQNGVSSYEGADVDVLAETAVDPLVFPGVLAGRIVEADIGFHTHDSDCSRIPWSFNGAKPATYDYYSVALHEMGHALGLAHLVDPNGAPNAMAATLHMNTEARITQVEIDALGALYAFCAGPGAPGPALNPPAAGGEENPPSEG
jgi:hypothetical protein